MNQNVFFILESVFKGEKKALGVFDSLDKARANAEALIKKGDHGWVQHKDFEISSCILNTNFLSSAGFYPSKDTDL